MGTYVGIARKNVQLSQARFHKRDVKKVFPDRAFCDGVTMGYVPHCDEERQIPSATARGFWGMGGSGGEGGE